ANLLLYAYDSSSAQHGPARRWLEDRLSGAETFGVAWIVLLAFIRLSTSPRVFESPFRVEEAVGLVESWLELPCVRVLHPGPRHATLLRHLLGPLGSGGNLTTDAHLAAIALEHDALLCSADPDFSRFPGLRWRNPLAEGRSARHPRGRRPR
ncbi:MAG: type II toxin-antitoxin system VapC family toxin, partial [Gaiellaceae bacterium]|nr:type II toxin-antitoxin system VapC family toxin [Gaiellaceae bacterium]